MKGVLLPKHIAVVMDGNGRWAKARFLPRTAGHKAGVKSVQKLIEQCVQHKIQALTLFAFSSENWERPSDEVQTLMDLFLTHLEKEVPTFQKHNIQFRLIGDRLRFSEELQARIDEAERLTKEHTGLTLVIAASYGGRWDITEAAKTLTRKVIAGELSLDNVDERTLGQYVCLADLPEPDLFIRTSGEQRMSNYLLWQLAYAELYFTEVLWPDFSEEHFDAAIKFFQQRERRFGKV